MLLLCRLAVNVPLCADVPLRNYAVTHAVMFYWCRLVSIFWALRLIVNFVPSLAANERPASDI